MNKQCADCPTKAPTDKLDLLYWRRIFLKGEPVVKNGGKTVCNKCADKYYIDGVSIISV